MAGKLETGASLSAPPSSSSSSAGEGETIRKLMDGGDSEGEVRHVMSEVHLGCPPGTSGPHLSRFAISLPSEVDFSRYYELFKSAEDTKGVVLDEDGDLVLPRRSQVSGPGFTVNIQHNITSTIPDVGLQVWKAELLLSDFVLHRMCTSSELDGIISIELGAGTGLLGILLARVAKTVFLTDRGNEILDNCAANVKLNSSLFNPHGVIKVLELNWMSTGPFHDSLVNSASQEKYSWKSSDIEEVKEASLIFAADVIYSNDLTDAFFDMLERLMSLGSEKVVYMALEKRYNFSLDDLDIVANGYSHFKSYLRKEGEGAGCGSLPCFVGKEIDIQQIPQYIEDYDRGKDLELWQIRYTRKESP